MQEYFFQVGLKCLRVEEQMYIYMCMYVYMLR